MNLRLRLAIEWVAIGLLATVIILSILLWRGASSFDNLLYDQLSAASRPDADSDIVLVTIDDSSLAALGQWPWDRSVHARLIEKLQALKPRTIAFDILLSERDNEVADAQLANAMRAGPAPIFIPLHFVTPGTNGGRYYTMLPVPIFANAATGAGHVNIAFDDDGIVRRSAICFQPEEGGKRWPHLMELVYRGEGIKPSPAALSDRHCRKEYLVPFASRGTFTEIAYVDLLESSVPAAMLAGKDVIIGATAAGMGDSFPTANGEGGLLSGIETMANILGGLRRDDFVSPLPMGWVILLSLLPPWLLLIGFLQWRPRVLLAMSVLSLGAILAASAALLSYQLWFPPGAALLGVLLIYPLWGWRRLQAMSDFMNSKLQSLHSEGEINALPVLKREATDLVGRQSEALARAIDEMRDLRRFVSDTLADLPDPMFVTDLAGCITLTNRLLDGRLEQVKSGMKLGDALDLIVVPEQRAMVDDYITDCHSIEFVRFASPLGRIFVMRRSEVRSDLGSLHGHIHYLADITTLARAEAEREQVLQLLSHDMRAPQSTIIALLESDIDADAKKRIERSARRTMQLAQDFVEIARMGETKFEGEDVLLADLVREAADGLWPLAHERGIKIVVEDSSDSAFALVEPDSMLRAVSNLVDNAIKFSPDDASIVIAIEQVASAVHVAISDQGEGIADELLANLFTRFASGGEQHGRVQGAGLGLTFVKAVIERHGGRITARNNIGVGATFSFSVPQAPEA